MIADRIVIENNEIVFRVDVETMASNAYSKIVDIQADVNEKASEVSDNTIATLQAKESVDESLSTVLQAKDDVTIKSSQVTLDAEQVATDRGIVATNLGLTETAKTEAQEAAGEITDNIDFTGLKQGDLLRYNGTKLVRINEVDFLKSKVPFQKSALGATLDLSNVFAWDNFIRPDSPTLGVSDSGHTWVNLVGDGFNISSNEAKAKTNGNISVINTGFGNIEVTSTMRLAEGHSLCGGLVIGKNASNYFVAFFTSSVGAIRILRVKDGVTTTVATGNITITPNGSFYLSKTTFKMSLVRSVSRGEMSVNVVCSDYPVTVSYNANTEVADYTSDSDVAFAGIVQLHAASSRGDHSNILITKLS